MPIDAKLFKRYPFSALLIALTLAYTAFGPTLHIHFLEGLIHALSRIETFQTNEILVLAIVFLAGLSVDQSRNYIRQRRKRAADKHRIQAVRSTMATVHDVVNNALNNLVLIRMEAERSQALSPDTLALFEDLIGDTAAKLRHIDELETFAEHTLGKGLKTLVMDKRGTTFI